MAQHYNPIEEERLFVDAQQETHSVLSLHNRQAPPPLQGERLLTYDRRLTDEVKKCAPNYKDVNLYDVGKDTFPLLKKQVFADARQEALNPTNVPEGTLREVTRHDAGGRPYYEFYGRPQAWMSQFSTGKKRLVGIRGPAGYQDQFTKFA